MFWLFQIMKSAYEVCILYRYCLTFGEAPEGVRWLYDCVIGTAYEMIDDYSVFTWKGRKTFFFPITVSWPRRVYLTRA